MEIVKTKSFELAAISKGNDQSQKVVICLPGRLDTKDYINFVSHVDFLSKLGFYTLSFDPPGTWESPGSIELFNTTNYIKAVNEMIEYLGNKPTILLGHSRGGAIAALAGTDNQNVSAIITINESLGAPSPPDAQTLKTGIYKGSRDIPPGDRETKERKKFEMSLNYFEDGTKYDDAEKLKVCTKPKLLFYAKNDEFNSPEYVKEVFASLPEPKELHELNCNHDYRYFPEVIEEVNKVIENFIKRYNLAPQIKK